MPSKRILFFLIISLVTFLLVENIMVAFYWMHTTIDLPQVPKPHDRRLTLTALTTTTAQSKSSCRAPLVGIEKNPSSTRIRNGKIPHPSSTLISNGKIPPIIHQTAKSRCVTERIAQAVQKWQTWSTTDWEYYFHDDEAVARLFHQSAQEFPLLRDVYPHCLVHGTLRADLWRYLVLWEYGGLYADIDSVPASLTPDWLEESDSFFVVEQYHLLSQYFIAVTPKHPLMWYAIQVSLSNLWKLSDTGAVAAAITTGPHALHQAFILFAKDGGLTIESARPGEKPVQAGTYIGTQGRSVTAVGVAERQNEIVNRDVLGNMKKLEYSRIGMTFHQDDKKKVMGKACFAAIRESKF